MKSKKRVYLRIIPVLTLAAFLPASSSYATDSWGVTPSNVMRTSVIDPISFSSSPEEPAVAVSIDLGNDILAQTVTFDLEATAGWHIHPIAGGFVIIVSGTLTWEDVAKDKESRCYRTFGPASIISEGELHPHNAWNLGDVPVVTQTLFILNSTGVPRVSVPDPYTDDEHIALPPPTVECP